MVFIGVLCSQAMAEDAKKQAADFVGVVQYIEGQARWSERVNYDPKQEIRFKSFFHYNDVLSVEGESSYLKLITHQRCVGVIYGDGILKSPRQKSNMIWEIGEGTSSRWICPQGATETLRIAGLSLELQSAEIFVHDGQLYLVQGRALGQQGELKSSALYKIKDNGFEIVSVEADAAHDHWVFNEKRPKPKEALVKKEPDVGVKSRWYAGPAVGGAGIFHNNGEMEDADFRVLGLRLATSHKWGDKSFIYSLTFHETETSDDGEPGPMGPQPGELFNFSRSDVLNAELGIRFYHDSSWSPYWKFGIAYEYMEIDIVGNQFNLNASQDYLHLTTALGIEKTFLTDWLGWGGLFLAGEVFAHQSVVELDDNIEQENYSGAKPKEIEGFPSSLTRVGFLVTFGGVLKF